MPILELIVFSSRFLHREYRVGPTTLLGTKAWSLNLWLMGSCVQNSRLQDEWKKCVGAIPFQNDQFPSAVMLLSCNSLSHLLALDLEERCELTKPMGQGPVQDPTSQVTGVMAKDG